MRRKIEDHQDILFSEEKREDLLHDFGQALESIWKWKAHILRSVNQEKAKQQVLDNLDNSSVLIVADWAMKFQQRRYREKQSDWYGKRGMSWHISSVVSKELESDTVVVTSYVHLFDSCTQDWYSVASIFENLLTTIKSSSPNVKQAYLRSDEAGCYHNNMLVAALKDIGARAGISVVRYDFSEPQQGKDICDRIICPLKSSIRRFCNEGNDIINAQDMQKALLTLPVKGTTASVNEIDESVNKLKMKKIKDFSSFHNFRFEDDGSLRVWKAFGVGNGKKITPNFIYISHQEDTKLQVKAEFPPVEIQRKATSSVNSTSNNATQNEERDDIFDCPEQACNCVFSSFEELELHLDVGKHQRFIESEGVYDTLKREWAKNFTTVTNKNSIPQEKGNSALSHGQCHLEMGWALSKVRSGSTRFPPNVCDYLVKKFDYGETTGHKMDPIQVCVDMRHALDEGGVRRFTREQWLSAQQIKGFFSRLARARRKLKHNESSGVAVPCATDVFFEDVQDESDSEEIELREELIISINNELNVAHPIFYDTYNLCDLHRQKKLTIFKVIMLKEICAHFELEVKAKDKKSDLISKISCMVEKCSCQIEK